MVDPDASPFEVSRGRAGDDALVGFRGELDLAAAAAADAALADAQAADDSVILDLRPLSFLDSSGLRIILAAQRRAVDGGGRLRVVPGDARIRRVFDLSGVDALIELVDPPAGIA